MKIFLDSIDLAAIHEYQDIGIINGVTTNPSLMAVSKMGFYETAKDICMLVKGDVSIEVASITYEKMIEEGNKILNISSNVVLKLPLTIDGLKACKYFSDKGYKVNMTLCFSVNQAILAAKCGAYYISPFIGRLEDVKEDGLRLIKDIRQIYNNYGYDTQILAASIRSTQHVKECAIIGADVVTVPTQILSELANHSLTALGLKKFSDDWAKSGMEI